MNRKDLDETISPTAAFGALIRRLREERGWTQEELGVRMGVTGSHISAIETGRKKPTHRLATQADGAFGTGDRLQRQVRALQQTSLLGGFPEYLRVEATAVEVRLYEVGVIPGLLQTSQYAATLEADAVRREAITPEQAADRVALVERRQASLGRSPSPLILAVLDEGCIRRPMGTSEIMRAQFDRLLEFAERPNTVLQIAPFSMGERRPFSLPVTILTTPTRALVSYAESSQRGHLEREPASVQPLLTAYHQLQAEALSQASSVAMIKQLRKGSS